MKRYQITLKNDLTQETTIRMKGFKNEKEVRQFFYNYKIIEIKEVKLDG